MFFLHFRNPVRDLLESAQTNLPPVGPLDCIDDHIERLFFDNEKVCVRICEFRVYSCDVPWLYRYAKQHRDYTTELQHRYTSTRMHYTRESAL